MSGNIPSQAQALASRQSSVLALSQLSELGLDPENLRNRARYGDWQRLQRGVYATYTGTPTREAELWAAILRAGRDAVLSHFTAAERHGLATRPSQSIHITVPAIRNPERCGKIPGVVIHRSNSVFATRHPALEPPCTTLEDTVLDLISVSRTFDAKFDWICKAVGGRLTTPGRLLESLDRRKRFGGREEVRLMLGYAAGGIMSWLERQWADGVERRHGFPAARRQAQVRQDTGTKYLDNLYEEYGLCVELDGTVAHPEEVRRRDGARDRWNLAHNKIITMRYRTPDLRDRRRRCEAAAELGAALRGLGAPAGHPCAAAECAQRFAEFAPRSSGARTQ